MTSLAKQENNYTVLRVQWFALDWLFPATPETRAGSADQCGVRTHFFLQRLMQLFNLHIISSDSYIHAHGVKNLALNVEEFN